MGVSLEEPYTRSSTRLYHRVIKFFGAAMKRIIEIRAAEGGEDSALFTKDLAQAYQRHFDRVG